MNRVLLIVTAFTLLMTTHLCQAAPPQPGPYASGFLGVTVPRSQDVNSFDYFAGKDYSDRVEFNPGVSMGGTGGYDFGIIRVEGEISYKFTKMKSITEKSTGYGYRDVDGTLDAVAFMFNTFLDIPTGSPVTPYLGGGIGFAGIHLSNTYGTDTRTTYSRLKLYEDDYDSVFAYQIGAGVEIALNRRLSLDLGYRYFCTDTARIGTDNHNMVITNIKLESHNANVGVRFKF